MMDNFLKECTDAKCRSYYEAGSRRSNKSCVSGEEGLVGKYVPILNYLYNILRKVSTLQVMLYCCNDLTLLIISDGGIYKVQNDVHKVEGTNCRFIE